MDRLTGLVGVVAVMTLLTLPVTGATIELPAGGTRAHLTGSSNLFNPDGSTRGIDTVDGTPAFITPPLGVESRDAFVIDSFVSGLFTEYAHTATSVELTGLAYDLKLVAISGAVPGTANSGPGAITLYFAALNRNPLVSSADIDGDIAGIHYGGVVEIYADPPVGSGGTTYNVTAGPGAWKPAGGVSDATANALHGVGGKADAYDVAGTGAPVSDGSLWLGGVLVEMPSATLASESATVPNTDKLPIVYTETLNFPAGTGVGSGFINIFGGDFQGSIGRGTFDGSLPGLVGADVQITSDLFFPGTEGYNNKDLSTGTWQVVNNDPADFRVVPEPATMLLVGGGLVVLARRVRTRRAR